MNEVLQNKCSIGKKEVGKRKAKFREGVNWVEFVEIVGNLKCEREVKLNRKLLDNPTIHK